MPFTTLGALMSQIGDYDEYRPIWIADATPLTEETPCFIVTGDASVYGEWEAIPPEAKDRGMVRFLSSGQMMDVDGALDFQNENYSRSDLLQALDAFFRTF